MKSAEVLLKSFHLEFVVFPGVWSDHNLYVESVSLRIAEFIYPPPAHHYWMLVEAAITLADISGFDNEYQGEVVGIVIAEVV